MLDIKDFSVFENQSSFDFKDFLINILSYWKWFLLSLAISFTIAYQVNIRKEKIYRMETLISVKEESNPLFTSNTSLVFNWGGTSDLVQTISTTIQSRSHNEFVVDKLHYFISYLSQGEYNIIDAYGVAPFFVIIDKTKGQLAGSLIGVKFISENEYEMRILFTSNSASLIRYTDNTYSSTAVAEGEFSNRYKVGSKVNLPFLNWKLEIKDKPGNYIGKEFFVKFNDFDSTVSSYRGVSVASGDKGGSIITLGMQGTNKARMVEYLNATVEMLAKRQLDEKNQFATNTIQFIDSTLVAMEVQLKETTNELKSFRRGKNIYDIDFILLFVAAVNKYFIHKPKESVVILLVKQYSTTIFELLKKSLSSTIPVVRDFKEYMVKPEGILVTSIDKFQGAQARNIIICDPNETDRLRNIVLRTMSFAIIILGKDIDKLNSSVAIEDKNLHEFIYPEGKAPECHHYHNKDKHDISS